jgi:murein DD-endopeptidase MepM/ murein hydrolase activator NlpD
MNMDKLKNLFRMFLFSFLSFCKRHKDDWRNPKFFTLMILPHDSTSVKKINLTSNWFKVFAILSVVFWISSLFMFFNYFSLKNKVVSLAEVDRTNTKQKIEMENLNTKVQFLETQLSRLQNIDLKVRELVNLEVKGSGMNFAGGVSSIKSSNVAEALNEKAEALEREIKVREKSLGELAEYLEDRKSLFMATPSLWPSRGFVTSEFGWRRDPISGVGEFHEGVDISSPYGTQVKAAAEGVVIISGPDGGYGRAVVIDHGYGIVTRYAHLSRSFLAVGHKVKKGGVVGAVGNSGKSTGPHVHYEVRIDGVPVNPLKYLFS